MLFLPHAIRQMSRPQRMISTDEVGIVVTQGELIEDYPSDPRGHSCLMLGLGEANRAVHVVCSPKGESIFPIQLSGRKIIEGDDRLWNASTAKVV